jgi:formate hydrogenlyase transcriptional activator
MASSQSSASRDGAYQKLLEILAAVTTPSEPLPLLQRIGSVLLDMLQVDAILFSQFAETGNMTQLATIAGWSQALPGLPSSLSFERQGTATEEAFARKQPVAIPDLSQAMLQIPQLASYAYLGAHRCAWVVPIATEHTVFGALIFASSEGRRFHPDDIKLMSCVSSQVAVTLDAKRANAEVATYRKRLEQERDRLDLLLDINNQIVTQKDTRALFASASQTIRKHFAIDFAGFWLKDEASAQFECTFLDFPSRSGDSAIIPNVEFSSQDLNRLEQRVPRVSVEKDIEALSKPVLRSLRDESIKSLVSVPLVTSQGAIGIISLGSRLSRYFTQANLDLIVQVGNQISLALENAIAYGRLDTSRNRLQDEKSYLESEIRSELAFGDIVGNSKALAEVLEQVAVVASTRSTVLLHGETGTGKELIARAIHQASSRRDRTFVKLNCAAIPSALVESELFGHEKGAFTGAYMQRRGRFEIADGGTLFLDEIGDIALDLQPKLLRGIQEQEFERVGGTRTLHVDVRLIAATHQDLRSMIRDKLFREDLYYRLSVFPIEIPPLRERREDIPLLVHYFVSRFAREMQKSIRRIPPEALKALTDAPWPGNVRELENFIERAVILTRGEELDVPLHDLSKDESTAMPAHRHEAKTLREAEQKIVLDALNAAHGQVSGPGGAAERLGVKRSTLRNKMQRLGITKSGKEFVAT